MLDAVIAMILWDETFETNPRYWTVGMCTSLWIMMSKNCLILVLKKKMFEVPIHMFSFNTTVTMAVYITATRGVSVSANVSYCPQQMVSRTATANYGFKNCHRVLNITYSNFRSGLIFFLNIRFVAVILNYYKLHPTRFNYFYCCRRAPICIAANIFGVEPLYYRTKFHIDPLYLLIFHDNN